MRKLFLSASLLLSAVVPAVAQEPSFESLNLLHAVGTVVIEPDGSVGGLTIDTKLDDALRPALERTLAALRFRPVLEDGTALRAVSSFDVLLAARRTSEKAEFEVSIDNIEFGTVKGARVIRDPEAVDISAEGPMKGPGYPRDAEMAGAMGRVLLAVRFNLDGSAAEAAVVRSQLYDTRLPNAQGLRYLTQFEKAAVAAALKWHAKVVPGSKPAEPKDFTAFTTVQYVMSGLNVDLEKDGQWLAVKRLPKRAIPWLPEDDKAARVDDSGRGAGLLAANGPVELLQPAKGVPVL